MEGSKNVVTYNLQHMRLLPFTNISVLMLITLVKDKPIFLLGLLEELMVVIRSHWISLFKCSHKPYYECITR